MQQLQSIIEAAFNKLPELDSSDAQLRKAVDATLELLDSGKARVAEKINGEWVTHQWLKKAVLFSFRLNQNQVVEAGFTKFYDKVPLKFENYSEADFANGGFGSCLELWRKGSYIAKMLF